MCLAMEVSEEGHQFLNKMLRSVVGHVIPASGRLVEVDIQRFPCPDLALPHQHKGTGDEDMVKELDLKVTLGMTVRRKT